MSDGYLHAGHAKYMLQVHLIFVTKYRKKLLYGNLSDDVRQFLPEAAQQRGCGIIRMETDKDHLLLRYLPEQSVSELAGWLKQYSTYKTWLKYKGFLSSQYWKKNILWPDGYFACSIGQVSQAVIERYIQNQG